LVIAVSASAITGCATIESSSGSKGIAYTLPKGQVQFTVERHMITPDDVAAATKAADEAGALVKADQAALTAAKDELALNQGALAKLPAGDPGFEALTQKVRIGTAVVAYITEKLKADAALHKAARQQLEAVVKGEGKMQETVAVSVKDIVPDSDRRARFVANMNHIWTRDDQVKLNVTNGLLSTANMVAKDRTGDILVEIAKIASLFVRPPVLPALRSDRGKVAAPPGCKPYHVSMVINPLDGGDVGRLQKALLDTTSSYRLEVSPSPSDGPVKTDPVVTPPKEPQSGLYYRAPIATNLRMSVNQAISTACGNDAVPQEFSATVVIPDTTQTYAVEMDAGAFTTVTQNVAFKDGMVTSFEGNRESELLAIVGVPIQIARAFMTIPTEFLQLKVNHDTTKTAEINAEVEQMKAQLDALKAAEALKNPGAGSVTPDGEGE
jgi:hypothetical protein